MDTPKVPKFRDTATGQRDRTRTQSAKDRTRARRRQRAAKYSTAGVER